MSNARPSLLKWRELKVTNFNLKFVLYQQYKDAFVQVKKTPIIKAKPLKLDYNSRLKKKYGR